MRDKSFIGGKWVSSGIKGDILNPATGEVIASVSMADEGLIRDAVLAADESFRSGVWSGKPPQERAGVLRKAAEIMRGRADEFAKLETMNVGKPLKESEFIDVSAAIDTLEYYASIVGVLSGESPNVGDGIIDFTRREPLGVVSLITPWNFPLLLSLRKSVPALLAGNSVVLKPAHITPLTTLLLAEVFAEAGLPDGVLNIVIARGSVFGKVMAEQSAIAKVSFTGSTEVGTKLLCSFADDLKATCMELGGKSPAIVCSDADMDKAVDGVLFGAFLNQGQCCCAATRLLLDKSISKSFIDKLIKAVDEKIVVGNPMDGGVTMGPLIGREHLENVSGFVERALKEGAKELYRGRLDSGLPEGGNWYPAVLLEANPSMEIYRKEVFGPVLTVTEFDGVGELIAAGNDTDYGLAASIFTESMSTAERAIRELQAGTVWVNVHNFVFNAAPYGGYKNSGIGRECGVEGLLAYTQIKNAIVYAGSNGFTWY